MVGRECLAHAERLVRAACRCRPPSACNRAMMTIDLALTNTFQRSFLSNVRSDKVKRGQRRCLCREHRALDRLAAHHVGWRGDYYAGDVNFAVRCRQFRRRRCRARQPEIHGWCSARSTRPNSSSAPATACTRTTPAARPSRRTRPIPTDKTYAVAAAGAHQGRGGRRAHQDHSGPRHLGQPVHPRPGFRDRVLGRCRRHRGEPRQPRYGFEWTNHYRPLSWIDIDADLAMTHARFRGFDSDQADALRLARRLSRRRRSAMRPAISFRMRRRWWPPPASRSARRPAGSGRCAGAISASSPLTEDNAFRSPATSIFNGRLGYRFENGWRIQLDVLNLFNTQANQITYAYGSLLKTDTLYNLCFPAASRRPRSARTA